MAEREKVAHLLRRATFGPTAEEVDEAEKAGYAATAERLINPPTPDTAPGPPALTGAKDLQILRLTEWWLDRMVATPHQYQEKLVFFWHGHWATSYEKVDTSPLMLGQQNLFRQLGRGDFARLRQGDGARSSPDPLARRPAQHQEGAEREPRARADGAVHDRHRQLHRGRRAARRPRADRLDGQQGQRRGQASR